MELINLKNQLSSEFQKRKKDRDQNLITELHEKINHQKTLLTKSYDNRRKEKLDEPVKLKVALDKKKSAQYKKIRAERIAGKKKLDKNTSNKKYTA